MAPAKIHMKIETLKIFVAVPTSLISMCEGQEGEKYDRLINIPWAITKEKEYALFSINLNS